MNFTLTEIQILAVSLAGIVWVWRQLIHLRRESLRFEIRQIRDELFDFMWKNNYDFDEPEYRKARDVLNGLIKMSNKTNIVEFLAIALFWPKGDSETISVSVTNEKLRKRIELAYHNAYRAWIRSLFFTGIIGVFVRAAGWIARTAFVFRSAIANLKSEVYSWESSSLDAAYRCKHPRPWVRCH